MASTVSSGRGHSAKGLSGSALVTDQLYQKQAKEAFVKATKDSGNLDVLARCKKLNEFLATVSCNNIGLLLGLGNIGYIVEGNIPTVFYVV
jgi:preprotein translocase subunit Sss1